jgi:hypothetical protein
MDHSPFAGLSALEWIVVALASATFLWVVWLAVRWTFHPGETDPRHVKRSILED